MKGYISSAFKVLKKCIYSSPLLYKAYFYSYRAHRGVRRNFFNQDTDYYFDGYPRSGNTYFFFLLKNIFPKKIVVHHLHNIAPLKIALKRRLPVFILYRNPGDAISSNYLKQYAMSKIKIPKNINIQYLIELSENYFDYYEFVLGEKKKIDLIHFKELITKPSLPLIKVSKKLGENYSLEYMKKEVESIKHLYKGGSSNKYGKSMPSNFKEKKKAELKECLVDISEYNRCVNTYERLIKI